MIKTVIFDIGNVLVRFDYMPFVRRLLGNEETVHRVNNAIWFTGLWNELDRGQDEEEILKKMIEAEPDYEEEIRLTFDRVGECIFQEDYAVPWIEELKSRGYQVLYLSNYSEHTMRVNPGALSFLDHMDGGVFSCYEKLIKPDPALFRVILERYELVPGGCVFIDDNEANVETARKLGFNAIFFKSYADAISELEDYLSRT